MKLVNVLTRILEFTAKVKLEKAQKQNDKAIKSFKKAKGQLSTTNYNLQKTQAEILMQFKKLDNVEKEIMTQKALNDKRIAAVSTAIAELSE